MIDNYNYVGSVFVVKIIQLSWSFIGQSFRKWLVWQAVADYSSWHEPNHENSNRQGYFYTTLYVY